MPTSFKQLMSLISSAVSSTHKRGGSMEDLHKRIDEMSEENAKLRKLYLKANLDIASLHSVLKTIAVNQAHLVSDVHAIYVAARDAGIMDEMEQENAAHSGAPDTDCDDDDDEPSAPPGAGGMLN